MTSTSQQSAAILMALKAKALDDFSLKALDSAERALADGENPLRINSFSTAMRILFEHMMETLAPSGEVLKCKWFKPETKSGTPSRGQRIVFSIQGGLSEEFVSDNLKVDIAPLRKRLLSAVDELSKHVHGRENTLITDPAEQDAMAATTIASMDAFISALVEARNMVLNPVSDALDGTAVDALLAETIQEVDELASHFSIEEIYVDKIRVHSMTADTIIYRATGTLSVILQWGSNSDVRNGNGAELSQSFPFHCDISVPIDDPWDLSFAETEFGVDTSSWRDAMALDG